MPIELLSNRPVEQGLHIIFIYINDITNGLFMKLLLTSVWLIVCFSLYFGQKNIQGKGDISMSMAIAGFVTVILATLFIMIPGLISGITFGTTIAVAVLGVLFFLSTKNE